jgi:hypothetical protein
MSSLSRDELGPLRRLAGLILTVFFAVLGFVIVAAACALLVPPIIRTAAFDARFTILPGFFYTGQPAKTAAFEVGCLAAPFLLFLSFRAAQYLIGPLSRTPLRRIIGTGLALHFILFGMCLGPIFYCPHPPLWITPRWLLIPLAFPPPVPTWEWIISFLAGGCLVLFFVTQPTDRRSRNQATILVLVLGFLLAPTRFYAPSEITDDLHFTYHLNSVLDALSQTTNGHHLLVDFPHIYGGYVEFLAVVLAPLPRTIASPLLVLAVPSVLAVLFLLLTARLVIRQPILLLLASLGLLSFSFLASPLDPNYGYTTARAVLPALGLFLVALYFRHPGPGRYLATSLFAAVAPIWNLDTGLVFWGGWLLTLVAVELAERQPARLARHVAIQIGLFLAAWILFFLHLRLSSGAWPDLHLLFYFQSMVVQSGYFCVPLLIPNAWISLVLLYLVGLAVALHAHLHRPITAETRMILLLSLLGIGTFSYYMGRSAETNLASVCAPGVLLLGVLGSKTHRQIARRQTPGIARWFLLPWAVMVLWWVILLFVQLPVLLARGPQLIRDWRETVPTRFESDAALVRQWIRPHESGVYFLSNHSGFYYYLTRTVRPLPIPGPVELFRSTDMNILLTAIQNRQISKLVVDSNFYRIEMYRPDIYQALAAAIAQNYRPQETSPSGHLTLCLPQVQGTYR